MPISMHIDKKSLNDIVRKLESMPKNMRRGATDAALRAGAAVVRDRARAKAPSCLVPSIKVVRRKKTKAGNSRVSVVAGGNSERSSARERSVLEYLSNDAKKARSKKMLAQMACPPAFWVEFGTYQNRNLTKDPYSPKTLKRHPDYARHGHSMAPNGTGLYWNKGQGIKGVVWYQAQPFLRPALFSASTDGSIEKAMAERLDKYFEKYGVK